MQHGVIHGSELVIIFGQFGFRMPGADHTLHGFSRGKGRGGCVQRAVHVDEELRVGVVLGQALDQYQGQGGLAHAAHPAHAGEDHAFVLHRLAEFLQFFLAAGEIQRRGRDLVEGGGGEVFWMIDVGLLLDFLSNYSCIAADITIDYHTMISALDGFIPGNVVTAFRVDFGG